MASLALSTMMVVLFLKMPFMAKNSFNADDGGVVVILLGNVVAWVCCFDYDFDFVVSLWVWINL